MDLPLPDSPTTPKISFFCKLKEMFFKIDEFPIVTLRFFTERMLEDFNFYKLIILKASSM